MSNSYFQFKQFRVEQGDCAMKVTTEACVLGAWVTHKQPRRILDIGTGTGLLALMLAQRCDCPIDAVEIDHAAAEQAKLNFKNSIWTERLHLHRVDVLKYCSDTSERFDLIVSNPPFFASNLKSINDAKNLAIHSDSLPFEMLLGAFQKLLSADGSAFAIYPEYEADLLKEQAVNVRLCAQDELIIKNKPGDKIFRKIVRISKETGSLETKAKVLHIRDEVGEHSSEFVNLLQSYYLHL